MKTKRREFSDIGYLLRFPHEDVFMEFLPCIPDSVVGSDGEEYTLDLGPLDLTTVPPSYLATMKICGRTKGQKVEDLIKITTPIKEQTDENNS